ncbi:MAG: GldG family protein [Treponema sp.]|nr:GldG family protein [Treponema sp.]
MKAFRSIYKQVLFSYRIDPLWYVTAVVTVSACALRFFMQFFGVSGSCDLRSFFSTVPLISILVIPLLVFRARAFISDDSLPAKPFVKLSAVATAAFTVFALPLCLLLAFLVPCIQSFGDIEPGQLAAGFTGILCYGFSAVSLCVFLFSAVSAAPAVSLLVSSIVLLSVNTVHLLSLYVQAGGAASILLQKISFAWHFDAAGKGIFDTRDISFFAICALFFLLLAAGCEYLRTGRKARKSTLWLLGIILVSCTITTNRLYARLDATVSRRFSVSETGRALCAKLEEPLRITYYRSKELQALYPQAKDIAEYLAAFAEQSRNVTLETQSVDEKNISRLRSLGISGTQIRSTSGSKTEYTTVYSAVVLHYGNTELLMPLVLSTQTLEYDLTRRVQDVLTERSRIVYIASGNGLALQAGSENGYGYLVPYLERLGFTPYILQKDEFLLLKPQPGSELLILGSADFTEDEAAAIERLVKQGIPACIATTPYSVAIENDWTVSKNTGDKLIPALRSWGFAFEPALVQDISCFPLSLQSSGGTTAEYQTINYPQWISVLPQAASPRGMTVFWTSPLSLYGDAVPLLKTSFQAWTQEEGESDNSFVVNPFLLPKTAGEAGAEPGTYTIAACIDGPLQGYYEAGEAHGVVTLIADQYTVSSLMTAYISSSSLGDFRNFDFIADQLLRLRGDEALANLLLKKDGGQPLYKITGEEAFTREKMRTLSLTLLLLPLGIITAGLIVRLHRRQGKNQKQSSTKAKKR